MKRPKLKSWLIALAVVGALSSCDAIMEDRDDCPTGLYVTFVYDYNIQRADMLKDHVGGLTLYVYDESDRLVASKTIGAGQLSKYGSYIHFTEGELPPGHDYRLMAVAMQKDWNAALATPGAKYRQTGNSAGSEWSQFFIDLDHTATAAASRAAVLPQQSASWSRAAVFPHQTRSAANYYYVSNAAPLDTLWHTLDTYTTPADSMPKTMYPAMLTPAKTDYTWQRDGSIKSSGQERVRIVQDEPTYATLSLIRDTKHLNVTLRALNYNLSNNTLEDNYVNDEDYTVEIIDNNSQLDCHNNLTKPADTLVYRPYQQWTTTFVGSGDVPSESAAHYDLMFNRLIYKNASVENDKYAILNEEDIAKAKNAVLIIRKKNGNALEPVGNNDSDIIFAINLPYILSSGRTWVERYYHYQEYLDREYDYRLQFIIRGGHIDEIQLFLGTHVHIIPWALRQQHEEF